jgi:regulator of protease activity HflC (stomatin/prohibitin superfamily)
MKASQIFTTAIALIFTLGLVMWGAPTYTVWQQEMAGKAVLAEASQSRQVQIEQAKAELESSKIRAQAIEVIGAAAKAYPEYRQQEYMAAMGEALSSGNIEQMIYIPTESNLPITEASRLN